MTHEADARAAEIAGDMRVAIGQLLRRLREQAEGSDLTRSQTNVLLRLEKVGSATATELARTEGITPQSMGAIVASLQLAGLVTGDPDPRDGRKTILSITNAARENFRTGRLAKEDWLSRTMIATLTPGEREQLAAMVPLLRRLASY